MDQTVLQQCKLFAGIDAEGLSAILPCLNAQEKRYPKNSFIFHVEESPSCVGIVLEGAVHLVQEDYWGNRTLIERVLPGGTFGEVFACTDEEKIPLNVIAVEDSTILFIDYKRIVTVCSSACSFHLQLIKNMMQALAYKNIALTGKVEHIGKRTLYDKILSYLSSQAIMNNSSSFTIPFSRQELADYLAVDRASLSRTLGIMKAEGVIRFKGRAFELIEQGNR